MAEFTIAKDNKGVSWRINLDLVTRIAPGEGDLNLVYFVNGDILTVGPIYTPLLQV